MAVGQNDRLALSEQLCFAAYSTAQAFNRVYGPLLRPFGLTYPQYLVLLVLWETDGLSVGQIGSKLHLDSGTLTPLLKRLEARQLVRRTRHPADERQVHINLTPQGKALRSPMVEVSNQVACSAKRSPGELADLRETLLALRDTLQEAAQS